MTDYTTIRVHRSDIERLNEYSESIFGERDVPNHVLFSMLLKP